MARLPGLTRSEDRPSVGGRNPGRVRTPEANLGERMLQPQARPVDTYSRPQQPNAGPNEWQQIAGALATINPKIGEILEADEKKARQDAEDRANKRIGGMTFEESKAAVDRGDMTELQDPWFKAAYMKQYGERLAYQRMNELSQQYAQSPDRETMNMDEFVAKQMKDDLDAYGSDKHFTKSYTQLMGNYSQKAGAAHAQYQSDQAVGDAKQGAYETFLGRARVMAGEGKSPQEIATALRSGYADNKAMFGMTFKEQDAEMLRTAQSLAEDGNFELVKAILQDERTGPDGTKLGKLADNRDHAANAARILENAERTMWKNNQKAAEATSMTFWDAARVGQLDRKTVEDYAKANPGSMSQAEVRGLIDKNDGEIERAQRAQATLTEKLVAKQAAEASERDLLNLDLQQVEQGKMPFIWPGKVMTENGDTKEVSIETRKANVAQEVVKQIDRDAARTGLNDQQKMDLTVERFATNGLDNPVWSGVLGSGMTSANSWSVSGGTLPPALAQGAELYLQLHAKSPALVRRHIKEGAALDFYEAYRIGRQSAGLDHEQAIQSAITITKDPDKFEGPMMRQTYEQIDNAVNKVTTGGLFGLFGSAPSNRNEVGREIARTAQFYARTGVDSEEAVKLSTERFKETHVSINDNWIPANPKDVPPNFQKLVSGMLEDYASENGGVDGDADDLTIMPSGNGTGAWVIVHKGTMMPVSNRNTRNVTLRTLNDADQLRQQRAKQGIIDNTNAENAAEAERQRVAAERRANWRTRGHPESNR